MKDFDESVVPEGPYCYNIVRIEPPKIITQTCPYWGCISDFGYCKLLEVGDWMDNSSGLLWDQVKECGINEGDDERLERRS